MSELSPMMKQYFAIKENYKDAIVFFRLGDFYEMFFDDAIVVSKALDLTLTGRDCGLKERAPMCGVPHHAVEGYLAKLINLGFKVAICEQVTNPQKGQIVERDVVRVVTAGTLTETALLDETKDNNIVCLFFADLCYGVAWCDLSSGKFNVAEYSMAQIKDLVDMLLSIAPAEIICNELMLDKRADFGKIAGEKLPQFCFSASPAFEYATAKQLLTSRMPKETMEQFLNRKLGICAAGALLEYIESTQKRSVAYLNKLVDYQTVKRMKLDYNARRNLELTETMRTLSKKGSLLSVIDKTHTVVGARTLRNWLLNPLYDSDYINYRLNAVEELFNDQILRERIILSLKKFRDLSRLSTKIALGRALPADILTVGQALKLIPEVKSVLGACSADYLKEIEQRLINFDCETDLIDRAILSEPSNNIKEGGYLKDDFDEKLSSYREHLKRGAEVLNRIEQVEREQTGIKTLKVGYNRIFGYYIEVSKGQINNVPFRYTRKQTLANCERFTTDELKEVEQKMNEATENVLELEQRLYRELCEKLGKRADDFISTSEAMGELDCLISLALVAYDRNYVKPNINNNLTSIKIVEGRHPVVEALSKEAFVPNDTYLDNGENQMMIITGPNMAGKSTYMRQVALLVILAHMGSFVPAKSADIMLVDRVFTRVGASDELALGQSTFMVEMTEVADILTNCTKNSLLILDEIGRGTSTFDGLSIAWAVTEYITKKLGVKSLFATHYHELTELEGVTEGIKNYRISVKEVSGSLIFLRKIVRGSAQKSFGIEVASLAGVPHDVLVRAREIQKKLDKADITRQTSEVTQMSMFISNEANRIAAIIKDVDTDNLKPIDALNLLIDLKERAKEL